MAEPETRAEGDSATRTTESTPHTQDHDAAPNQPPLVEQQSVEQQSADHQTADTHNADTQGAATRGSDTAATDAPNEANPEHGTPEPDAAKPPPRKGISGVAWALLILTLLAAELYAYGHNGEVRVCVGRKGLTDFTQLDKPRQGNLAAGYPFCVESLNLGMYSRSDDVAKEALDVACARASALLRGEKSECIRRDKDWIRRVDKTSIPPWDPRLYKRLFFIE